MNSWLTQGHSSKNFGTSSDALRHIEEMRYQTTVSFFLLRLSHYTAINAYSLALHVVDQLMS
eukprot:scaffold174899_cov41-Prasinocladus_malaysianus.AAC.1